jgi:hypothetical protein
VAKGRIVPAKLPFDLNGKQVYLTVLKLKDEYLFLATPAPCAKTLKTGGFNLEDTPVTDPSA